MKSEFYRVKSFLCLDGPAKAASSEYSRMKVCITCRDQNLLRGVLLEMAGEMWAKYKNHPRLFVDLQDDDFAAQFRSARRAE